MRGKQVGTTVWTSNHSMTSRRDKHVSFTASLEQPSSLMHAIRRETAAAGGQCWHSIRPSLFSTAKIWNSVINIPLLKTWAGRDESGGPRFAVHSMAQGRAPSWLEQNGWAERWIYLGNCKKPWLMPCLFFSSLLRETSSSETAEYL